MAILEQERSVVVVIDMQGRLMEIVHRHTLVLGATQRLLAVAKLFDVPVVVTEQYPSGLGPTHPEIKQVLEQHPESVQWVEKDTFSCCGEPEFLAALTSARPDVPLDRLQVVVVGIEAHICVVQTVLQLIERGVEVQVCWEATSGRGAEYRDWALERMQQAGATITNLESVGFEWARDKNHPQFKSMSRLFREGQLE